ncbi:MAG: helix-turn-helix transcriptional regulator [Collinsella sp.]
MPRGVWSWCCAPQGREIRRPKHLGAIGVFLGVIATVPEWADLAFYARGDSIPFVFAPIWLLRGVSCASCFTGSLLLSYVIWNTAGSPLIRGGAGRRKGDPPTAERTFAETVVVLSCLLFCCRVSWRVVPEPWDVPCNGRINWPYAFNSSGLSHVGCGPLLCCPRAFGRGQGDVFARSVLVAVPIGLVPAVEEAYFASDATVIASLSTGSAIAVAAFVYTLLREKRDNNSDTPRTSDPFDAGVFSPALSPREEQFVRLLLKGKTPAEIARETGTKPSTVRTTLHRAYGRASVAGSGELVALFAGEGDAVGPEPLQRHADDLLVSARTRRLFRYLLTSFSSSLRRVPW